MQLPCACLNCSLSSYLQWHLRPVQRFILTALRIFVFIAGRYLLPNYWRGRVFLQAHLSLTSLRGYTELSINVLFCTQLLRVFNHIYNSVKWLLVCIVYFQLRLDVVERMLHVVNFERTFVIHMFWISEHCSTFARSKYIYEFIFVLYIFVEIVGAVLIVVIVGGLYEPYCQSLGTI